MSALQQERGVFKAIVPPRLTILGIFGAEMIDRRLLKRHYDVLLRIPTQGARKIGWLTQDYKLTCQRIRRDIHALCTPGLAKRLHGGVDQPVQQNASID